MGEVYFPSFPGWDECGVCEYVFVGGGGGGVKLWESMVGKYIPLPAAKFHGTHNIDYFVASDG